MGICENLLTWAPIIWRKVVRPGQINFSECLYEKKKNKTELRDIILHSAPPPLSHIHVCDERALASPRVGNTGVLFGVSLSMSSWQ